MTMGADSKDWISEISHFLATSELLNSNFGTALLGSLAGAAAGALAGAWIVQRIAARAALKEQLLNELRSTNAAISVAYSICQSGLRLKASGVQALKADLDQTKAEILRTIDIRARQRDAPAEPIRFLADLQTITSFPIPSDALQKLIFEKIDVKGRPHQLALQIPAVWHSLTEAISSRNQLISEFKTTYGLGGMPYQIYFGMADEEGHVDARYSTSLEAIYQQTDDCIWFAKTLSEDLQKHGEIVHEALVSRFGRRSGPRVTTADFGRAAGRGLLPPDENYQDWVSGFVVRPPEPTRFELFRTAIKQVFKWTGNRFALVWRWCVRKVRNIYFALSLLHLWKRR